MASRTLSLVLILSCAAACGPALALPSPQAPVDHRTRSTTEHRAPTPGFLVAQSGRHTSKSQQAELRRLRQLRPLPPVHAITPGAILEHLPAETQMLFVRSISRSGAEPQGSIDGTLDSGLQLESKSAIVAYQRLVWPRGLGLTPHSGCSYLLLRPGARERWLQHPRLTQKIATPAGVVFYAFGTDEATEQGPDIYLLFVDESLALIATDVEALSRARRALTQAPAGPPHQLKRVWPKALPTTPYWGVRHVDTSLVDEVWHNPPGKRGDAPQDLTLTWKPHEAAEVLLLDCTPGTQKSTETGAGALPMQFRKAGENDLHVTWTLPKRAGAENYSEMLVLLFLGLKIAI